MEFEEGVNHAGDPLAIAAGIGWLANLLPGSRKTLTEEAKVLHPMLLSLAGDTKALAELFEVLAAEDNDANVDAVTA